MFLHVADTPHPSRYKYTHTNTPLLLLPLPVPLLLILLQTAPRGVYQGWNRLGTAFLFCWLFYTFAFLQLANMSLENELYISTRPDLHFMLPPHWSMALTLSSHWSMAGVLKRFWMQPNALLAIWLGLGCHSLARLLLQVPLILRYAAALF